jgi:two-component system, OmpR family, response regulator
MLFEARILVVDDDPEICELLDEYLTKAGFDVETVENGEALLNYLDQQGYPDLILLDVMMPGNDGFTLCQKMREESNVPIIMLTAVSDETDQIIGLEIGADDYIAKPFSPRQLVARIKAVLRRVNGNKDEQALPSKFIFGDWSLDTVTQRMTHLVSHEASELSGSDYALLVLFLTHPKEVLDKDTISYAIKGREALPNERAIDVQLSRLRQRLGSSDNHPSYIKTMRGNGYILSVVVESEL